MNREGIWDRQAAESKAPGVSVATVKDSDECQSF
jgi:hypothetical protein